jgi:magnesium transporter
VDAGDRLVGVLNMRDLLLASGDAALETVMRRDVFSLSGFMDRAEAAAELGRRRFLAAPVIDGERRLVGLVKAEQFLQEAQRDVLEDIQRMVGAGPDERSFSPVGFSVRKRLPWLYVNLATAFLAAAVVALFEDLIARITILAVFLPVVAGQGGNAGAQSLAVVMRGLVMREIPKDKVAALVTKEGLVGALNGLFVGLVTAGIAWWWGQNPFLGLVIGLAMLVNLVAAGLSGALIPLTMKALGFDPAQSSSIVLTTVTDVVGFLAFLGFALVFQQQLM